MEDSLKEHFFEHGKKDTVPEIQLAECHWCQIRSFPSHETIPVTISTSGCDNPTIPKNFRFIADMVRRQGVEVAEDSFRSGCACSEDRDCQFSNCLCLADLDADAADSDRDGGSTDEEMGSRKTYAYHSHGAKKGLLRSKMLTSEVPIYECHEGCDCSPECPNRIVERGRMIPLQIFHTNSPRGWGVRSSQAIRKGQFIDRYVGEIITSAEADRRRAEAEISQRKDVYLFALDKFTDPQSLDSRLKGPPLEVDGEFMSGPSRFINHSCGPNLRIFARVGDHVDKHVHDLALFAIKDIPSGEEFTFDYVDGVLGDGEEPASKEGLAECLCGSPQCRGFLW